MAVMRGSHKNVHVNGATPDRAEVYDQTNTFHNANTAPDGGWTGFDAHDSELNDLKSGSLGKTEFAGYKGLGIVKR